MAYFLISLSVMSTVYKNILYSDKKLIDFFASFFIIIFLVYILISRDIFTDSDTERYLSVLNYFRLNGYYNFDKNYIFTFYSYLYALYITSDTIYILIPFFILLYTYRRLVKIIDKNSYALALILLIAFPVFWQLTASAFKQCMAIALLILATEFYIRKKILHSLIFSILALNFHFTSAIFLLFLLFMYFTKEKFGIKFFLFIWGGTAVISILGVNTFINNIQLIKEFIGNDKASIYLTGLETANRFRLDFFIFSLVPVVIIFINKNKFSEDIFIKNISIIYLFFNAVYNIFSFIPFSDRVAAYSWVYFPLILLWCALKCKGLGYKLITLFISLLVPIIFITYNSMFIYSK